MKRPRRLLPDEAELWARVASTVAPLKGRIAPPASAPAPTPASVPLPVAALPRKARSGAASGGAAGAIRAQPGNGAPSSLVHRHPAHPPLDRHGLDSSWDRKLGKGEISPDFTLDLHGATLDVAHSRLDHGLAQARMMGARLVLLITGKPRVHQAADRGSQRGAIRAKIQDWLALGPHAHAIAAIRAAHRRHGGAGALYVVLRRPR